MDPESIEHWESLHGQPIEMNGVLTSMNLRKAEVTKMFRRALEMVVATKRN